MFTNLHLLGWAAEPAAYIMSKQWLQQHTGVGMNLFMAKKAHSRKDPCVSSLPPLRADIYEDIPSKSEQQHYHSQQELGASWLHLLTCQCCTQQLKPNIVLLRFPIYNGPMWAGKVRKSSMCISYGIFGEALSDSTFYTLSSVRVPPSTSNE